ncbi:NADH-quinone oxidoreductase subunit L [Rudaeicoccus suwonensis]|uniref:NADH-quinone oxidoreductase subunit L n=1 Tax=Rudaeicoccus suwonensis TaxID=657409 RepID=A0A561E7K5_9MICO|nr:NADH-quinone oxidoreductase subunit L [Rudaeicoccus suwonensis]TWE11581.1 NADH-quinone oxidoreductase subunit L [Rudaeicoccus suwonensis]
MRASTVLASSVFDQHTLALHLGIQPSHLAILLPAAVAALVVLVTRGSSRAAFVVAATGSFLGLLAAIALLAQQVKGGAVVDPRTIGALPVGTDLGIPLRLHVNDLAALVSVAVALVSWTVQLFARWYLFSDPRYRQFAATVGLFTAAMQLVVLSGDVLLTVVGWELMGWCSYLLIGHESERGKARRAAYKAFIVTRLADAPFLVGLVALAIGAHSTSISAIVTHWSTVAHDHHAALAAAMICIVCGVAGKSAQFPFQDWLPDAMEGPTPASALIHAATMVAAGTVVLASLLPLLERSDPARLVLTISAAISTVLAAVLAFCQHDLKKLLAWSTVSQVGLMLLGLAVMPVGGTASLGIEHLLAHAMFKALLFLTFGWLAVLAGGTAVERFSGALNRHRGPRTLVGIGLLSLAGVPPLMGFVSKDLIVDQAARQAVDGSLVGQIAFVALICVVALTAAYTTRVWLILTRRTGSQRVQTLRAIEDSYDVRDVGIVEMLVGSAPVDAHGRPVEIPEPEPEPEPVYDDEPDPSVPRPGAGARAGLQLLAIFAIVGGALVFTPLLDIDWRHSDGWLIAAALVLMAAVALLVRWMSIGTVYGDAAARLPLPLRSSASRGLDVDAVYQRAVARPVLALAHAVSGVESRLDRTVQSAPAVTTALARRGASWHTRKPETGLVAVALGLVIAALVGATLW